MKPIKKDNDIKKWYQSDALFYISLSLFILFSFLLFDFKIAIGGDDAEYIVSAKNFFDGVSFPGWHGVIYPIMLSLIYAIFGMNITIFKVLSLILLLIQFVIFYLTFKDRIKPIIYIPVLLILSINYFIIFNASQTSSEPLYLALQAVALFYFFKLEDERNLSQKYDWLKWLLLGLFTFLLSQTRNIGYSFIVTVIILYCLNKDFRSVIYFIINFLIFFIPFNIYKYLVWNSHGTGVEGQFKVLFYKNPYNAGYGYETFGGFIERFFSNANYYISNSLIKLIGLRSLESKDVNWFITTIIIAVLLYLLYISFRKNKLFLFLILYIGVTLSVTFISQQSFWAQDRLMIVVIPFFLLILFNSLDNLKLGKDKDSRYLIISVSSIIFIGSTVTSIREINKNLPILQENLTSNEKLYGYTPDYKHYIQVSQWAGKNIDKKKVIGCRKAHLSTIYSGGGSFVGIFNEKQYNINSVRYDFNNTFVINLNDYYEKIALKSTYPGFHSYIVSFIYGKMKNALMLYSIPDTSLNNFLMQLKNLNIAYQPDFDNFKKFVNQNNVECYAINPDSLLQDLKLKNIEYLLIARLRAEPSKKGDQTQNIIEDIALKIYAKYPGIIKQIINMGNSNDEPAGLLQIDYNAK